MKYKMGSQWKTRGGWRAVVVDDNFCNQYVRVYHHEQFLSQQLKKAYKDTGMLEGNTTGKSIYDLIEPWKEPVVHEGYISLFSTGYLCRFDKTKDDGDCPTRIACVPFKYTEGDGLE